MKNKQLALLALIFVTLLAVVKGLEFLNRDQGKPQVKKMYSLSADKIDQVTLSAPSESVTLQKINGSWQVTAPVTGEANQTSATSLVTAIVNLTTDGTSSTNAEKQDTYEVSDTAGTKVTVVGQGKTLATFYLGKTSSDYSHTYVRADGSNAIKTAKGSLKATFVRTSTDWRNKVITSVAADSIQSILVAQQGSEPFTLLKDTASWILSPATVTIDQTKTTAFVTALSAVNASDFVADPDALALDLASPAVRITLQTVADSSILDLYVKDGAYYAKTNASSQIFVIAQYSFDALNKKPADLI